MSKESQYLFHRAVAAEKNGNSALALRIYQQILELDRNFRPALINLGTLLSKAGRYRLAIRSLKRAYILKQDFIALFNLGVLFYRIHRFQAAASMFSRAAQLQPDFTRVHILLGFARGQLGQVDKAQQAFEQTLKYEPDHHQALLALAFLHYSQRDYSKSRAYAEQLTKSGNKNQELRQLLTRLSLTEPRASDDRDEQKLAQDLWELFSAETNFQKFDSFLQESAQDWQQENRVILDAKIAELDKQDAGNARDALDMSLMYLFSGNPRKAAELLAKAKIETT